MRTLSDARRYLSARFSDNEANARLWYDMVGFLFGDRSTRDQSASHSEMVRTIKAKLIAL